MNPISKPCTQLNPVRITASISDYFVHLQDEEAHRPFVSRVINHLANYQGGIVPNIKQRKMQRQDSDAVKSGCRPKKKHAASKKAVCGHLV